MSAWLPVLSTAAWAILLGGLGGVLTEIGDWYTNLRKPAWQPPDWAFGPVWTTILGLVAYAAVIGWHAAVSDRERADLLIVYAVNFLFHLTWSPLFFKLKRPDWSLIEVVFLWASVVAMIVVLAGLSPFAAWLIAPYILWVSIAALLNRAIVRLNGPFNILSNEPTGKPHYNTAIALDTKPGLPVLPNVDTPWLERGDGSGILPE